MLVEFKERATSKDPLEKLGQMCKTYVSFGLDNPELYDLMFIIRAPMNVDAEEHKDNGGDCFGFLMSCLEDCMKKDLLIFNDLNQAALQVWAMGHGLVSLNIRCRLKMLIPTDEAIRHTLNASIEEYLKSIRK